VDEVTRRLKDGVPTGVGESTRPKIVRIGADASIHPSVKDVHLDVLVNARLTSSSKADDGRQGEAVLQERINENQRQTLNTQAELDNVGDNQAKREALEARLVQLKGQRTVLFNERSRARDAAKDATRQMDGARRQARQDILNEADIICSTLSGAGHDSISGFDFETVIIDEAAQAVELSALVPLKYRCTRCIMIGGKTA
jgi:senataxin